MIAVQQGTCKLFELFNARPSGPAGTPRPAPIRPSLQRAETAGWTRADAAGLPILAGLVRYDEAAAGR